ncbi:Type IV fimbrial assembly, ATPase PilB [Dissulfuribacter thermophilus]|uniref:Type IV fimbrial assembly, ATPase PilB n=1 Tax=Dissulfuribacter thermophilus TaxID=1156395 RepID=A0A1B9F5H7_9BACT|nr:GspE/PulE family protein [Dissulfuribacter thermophilus]OCC15094.1 Type IV fimbrial assembly, ATPase PilB [Dissulfuribacter thermophilus]
MPQTALPIGQLLKEHGLIEENEIEFALQEQKATGERLGECLTRLGLVTETELSKALAAQSGLPFIDLRTFTPDQECLKRLPVQAARQKKILPLWIDGAEIHVAISDPYDTGIQEIVFRLTGLQPRPHIGARDELEKLIEWFYHLLEHPADEAIEEVTTRLRTNPNANIDVNQLVDLILTSAVSKRTTDIHLTPSDVSSRVMFRIDGVLRPAHVFPSSIHHRLITNIKVRSGMDISEQRKPQDGRMTFEFLGDSFDIRVSSVRTNFGENMVLRLLPSRGGNVLSIVDLGFEDDQLKKIRTLFARPHGMVLVTGPTGSGKTTTLYAALREQDAIGKNIITVEDPIEYEFLMIRQTQVNERAGYTFSSAIRTFLRQDPDVILVGEIRDEETAVLATRAALTGHLVLSTLHTNTTLGAIARLIDLGISPYLLSTSLIGVIAQRLLRRLCPKCKEPYDPEPGLLKELNLPPDGTFYRATGCPECQNTGYSGRTVVGEVLYLSKTILTLIAQEAPLGEIEAQARKEGFYDFAQAGIKKITRGETSIEEYQRVIG